MGAVDCSEEQRLDHGGRRHRVHPPLWKSPLAVEFVPKDETFSVHLPAQWRHGKHQPFFVDLFPDGTGMERLQGCRYACNVTNELTRFGFMQHGWITFELEEYR
jgi:hypothetical protein